MLRSIQTRQSALERWKEDDAIIIQRHTMKEKSTHDDGDGGGRKLNMIVGWRSILQGSWAAKKK